MYMLQGVFFGESARKEVELTLVVHRDAMRRFQVRRATDLSECVDVQKHGKPNLAGYRASTYICTEPSNLCTNANVIDGDEIPPRVAPRVQVAPVV